MVVNSSSLYDVHDGISYVRSNADLEGGSSLSDGAVSGSQNSVAVQERTTAEVASALLERDDEGELALGGGGSTNNGVFGELALGELGVLGNGGGRDQGGSRKGNEDVFELHLE
jgi:hypothetical protein